MTRWTVALALAAFVWISAGCYTAPVMPPIGFAFSNVDAPIDIDMDPTDKGSKVGKASAANILGLFSFGDASIATAARNGGITTAKHADYEFFNILGIYQSFTTVVHGD